MSVGMRCVMCMDPFDWRVCEWMLNEGTEIYGHITYSGCMQPPSGYLSYWEWSGVFASSDPNFITINE